MTNTLETPGVPLSIVTVIDDVPVGNDHNDDPANMEEKRFVPVVVYVPEEPCVPAESVYFNTVFTPSLVSTTTFSVALSVVAKVRNFPEVALVNVGFVPGP